MAIPSVVAHRGASVDRPEHTPAAYLAAIRDGADAFECDVRLTADRQLVCVHDARLDRTSSGRGAVSSHTLAELAALDWGSWRTDLDLERLECEGPRGVRGLLTLEALIGIAASAGRPVDLAIETKHPNRFGAEVEERLAKLLADVQRDAGQLGEVRMMSFSALAVRRMHALVPELRLVFLMDRIPAACRGGRLPTGATVAGLDLELVRRDPGYVEVLLRAGHAVHVWTVDDPDDARRCAALGVEAIITNRPREVRAALEGA